MESLQTNLQPQRSLTLGTRRSKSITDAASELSDLLRRFRMYLHTGTYTQSDMKTSKIKSFLSIYIEQYCISDLRW